VKIKQKGSYIRLKCPRRKSVTVPDYKEVNRGLLRKILRDADISIEEFLKLIE
jgi:predicted RNA binding protein YcfA (HicA-like mRNA interferase family)